MPYDINYMQNPKNKNQRVCKTETFTDKENKLVITKEKRKGQGEKGERKQNICKYRIHNEYLLPVLIEYY